MHQRRESSKVGAMGRFVIASLYKFVALSELELLRNALLSQCRDNNICGTLLLAPEGINGTVSGSREAIDAVLAWLREQPGLSDLDHKESFADTAPFHRLKVRIKDEIVTLRDHEVDPRARVGTYVDPQDWNALIADPDVIVIDTRNAYEVRVGSFKGAVDPGLENFCDFPAWAQANLDPQRQPKIAMYCTGGIRCEKASSLLLREGFPEVYHLKGGILRYLEKVDESSSAWDGECFVFDQRVALDHNLAPGHHTLCFGCREPVAPEDRQNPDFENNVCCPRCAGTTDEPTRERRRERARQIELAAARGERHIGR